MFSRFGIRAKTENMSDIIPAIGKIKEGGGSSSIKCPMLTSTNFMVCTLRMKVMLRVHKGWEAIEDERVLTKTI